MAGLSSRRRAETPNYWPGFVDAMATLLLVIIFMLSVFMIAQFFLSQEITGKDSALDRLNNRLAELEQLLSLSKADSRDLESQLALLQVTLQQTRNQRDSALSRLSSSTGKADKAGGQIATLSTALEAEKSISREALAQVEILNQQLAALRRQIAALQDVLDAAKEKDTKSRAQIADLGRRLNLALAQRVQELNRYRSDFFGRLREILSQRSDIRVVGDRFVFQSEVLFTGGSASINAVGKTEMAKLGKALIALESQIPDEINWVLRVDGHTDNRPIKSARFPSNWELSAARAISVVKYLVEIGVPANRLVAAGFGEFQPIESGESDEALARNRRIELKLTER